MARRLFTSESVTEGHPDKMADQISDAILDAMLKGDPHSRVAVETLITTGQVHVAGEVTTATYVDIPRADQGQDPGDRLRLVGQGLRRRVVRRVGVDRLAVARHRPGRQPRLRAPRGRRGRRTRPSGRRRPGPDVRLRQPGNPRADAVADHAGAQAVAEAWPRCATAARSRTSGRTGRRRSRSSTPRTSRSGLTPSWSRPSTLRRST